MGIGAKQLGLNEKKTFVCTWIRVCLHTKCKGIPVGCRFLTSFCYNSCNLNMEENIATFLPLTPIVPAHFIILKRHVHQRCVNTLAESMLQYVLFVLANSMHLHCFSYKQIFHLYSVGFNND